MSWVTDVCTRIKTHIKEMINFPQTISRGVYVN